MILYALQVSLCWCVFYLIYILFLRKETFFSLNRWYLNGTLLLGLLIPAVRFIPLSAQQAEPLISGSIQYITIGPELVASQIQSTEVTGEWLLPFLFCIYIIGVVIGSTRFLFGLSKIYKIYRGGRKEQFDNYTIVHTEDLHLPFSFLNKIFISKLIPLKEDMQSILTHEISHISKKHTYDVLLFEIVAILFWWNPLVYLYKKAIRETHEFMADSVVLKDTEEKIYGQILLRQSSSGLEIALAHQFFNSHFKTRMQMMYQDKSKRQNMFKYLFALPFLGLMALAFSSYVEHKNPELNFIPTDMGFGYEIQDKDTGEKIGYAAAVIAENYYENTLDDESEIFLSGDKITPPLEHKINPFQNYCVHFEPNEVHSSDQKSGSYFITLNSAPSEEEFEKDVLQDLKQADPIFKVVEEMPRFPGCEDMEGSKEEKEECSKQKMLEYIYKNVRYPETARKLGIEGVCVVQFVVEKDGSVAEIELKRDIGGGCGEESKRVVESFQTMPEKWTPGKQKGKAVRVQYVLPIRYKLEGDSPEESEIEPVTFIDGKRVSKAEVKALDPNRIESIEVFKGEEAFKKAGEDGKNGVIYIKTKEKSEIDSSDSSNNEEIFKVVEEMPRFPGCEDITMANERDKCSKQKMLEYIYKNLKYPKEARNSEIEGMVVVQFTVSKTGDIKDIEVLRKIGGGCDEAAFDVVESMNHMAEKWIPGKQRGKTVNVRYTLPIRYKLDSKAESRSDKNEEKNEREDAMIKILGNPVAGGILNFDYMTMSSEDIQIELFDINGRRAFVSNRESIGESQSFQVDVKNLPAGNYTLKITQGKEINSESIILK